MVTFVPATTFSHKAFRPPTKEIQPAFSNPTTFSKMKTFAPTGFSATPHIVPPTSRPDSGKTERLNFLA